MSHISTLEHMFSSIVTIKYYSSSTVVPFYYPERAIYLRFVAEWCRGNYDPDPRFFDSHSYSNNSPS